MTTKSLSRYLNKTTAKVLKIKSIVELERVRRGLRPLCSNHHHTPPHYMQTIIWVNLFLRTELFKILILHLLFFKKIIIYTSLGIL